MSTFAFQVLTPDGANLIAQATAANPIVWVSALSRATAAANAADLAEKPVSWYTGKTGEIASASAMGTVARVVARWDNEGAAQAAKSMCITARLASQTDADAVVVTAVSDPNSNIILPGATDISAAVEIPFPITITATDTVETTPGASASVADLDRFVSIHKAGDPTQGEPQTIHGQKSFANGVTFNANIIPSGNISFGDASHTWKHVYAEEINLPNFSIYYDDNSDAAVIDYNLSPSEDYNSSLGRPNCRWDTLYCVDVVTERVMASSRKLELKASQSMIGDVKFICDIDSAPVCAQIHTDDGDSGEIADFYFNHTAFYASSSYDYVDLGTSNSKFGNVYAMDFRGRIPHSEDANEPPFGAIFFGAVHYSGSSASTVTLGQPLQVGAGNVTIITAAEYSTANNRFETSGAVNFTTGIYRALSVGSDPGGGYCFVLLIRVG